MKFTPRQKRLRTDLLSRLYQSGLSHIGSSVSVIDIIDAIYSVKSQEDKFVLSNGHAAAALYSVLATHDLLKDPSILKLGVHPERNSKNHIDVSTGSLGQGLPIAVGMALADSHENVYCVISDGEAAEGSIWEALRLGTDLNTVNLKVVVSANGWGAYDPIDPKNLKKKIKGFGCQLIEVDGHNHKVLVQELKVRRRKFTVIFARTHSQQHAFLQGLDAHYHTMTEEELRQALKELA